MNEESWERQWLREAVAAPPTLTDFLLARIAEDEEVARVACEHDPSSRAPIWTSLRSGKPGVCDHGPRGSVEMQPTRVLAECDAKRRIVRRCILSEQRSRDGNMVLAADYLASFEDCRDLALPYADHPDYREEWKP